MPKNKEENKEAPESIKFPIKPDHADFTLYILIISTNICQQNVRISVYQNPRISKALYRATMSSTISIGDCFQL